MYDQDSLKELARAKTRDTFRNMPTFLSLDVGEQKELFREAYRRNYDELAVASHPRSGQQSVVRAFAEPKKASDMIDDKRHENRRIEQAGELAGEFVDEVDFPGFVKDLLKGGLRREPEGHDRPDDHLSKVDADRDAVGGQVRQRHR